MRREGYVTDTAVAVPVDHRIGDVVEGLRLPGTGVEYTRNIRVLQEPEIHGACVVYVDEVPQLFAVPVTAGSFEQPRFVISDYLVIEVKSHAGHRPLVLFARPVDVEIAQPDDLALGARRDPAHVTVELQLGVTVHIQGQLVFGMFRERLRCTVDRRR